MSQEDAPKVDAWMPLYIGDYLADTAHLTTEQHGAYLLLMFHEWRTGPIPDDDAILARITKLTLKRWMHCREVVKSFYHSTGGKIVNKRVEEEKTKAEKRRKSLSQKGLMGSNARWGKNASGNAPGISQNASGISQAMPKRCPSPSPSPSHTNTRALSTACPKAEIPPSGPPSPMLEVLLTFPVVGEPKTWDFTAGNRDTLAMGYPHLDIMAEVRKALVWIDANAPNRKTARGMKSFLNRWMNKAQNNGHPLPAYSKVPRGTFTPEEEAGIDADIRARHEGNGQ